MTDVAQVPGLSADGSVGRRVDSPMPIIAPTSDRFVALTATLHVSERLVGSWLAGRTGCSGTIVSLNEDGRGRFQYMGTAQWWLQLRARSTLAAGGRRMAVRITGHQAHAEFVIVDFVAGEVSLPLAAAARHALEEQRRLDMELGAYWDQQRLPIPAPDRTSAADEVTDASIMFNSALIDALPDPIFVVGPDGRYLGVNQAFAEAAGHPISALVGQYPRDIWCQRSPSGWEGGAGAATPEPTEVEVIWGDGCRRRVMVRQYPVQLPGTVGPGVVGTLQDVSAGHVPGRPRGQAGQKPARPLGHSEREVRSAVDAVVILSSLLQAQVNDSEVREQAEAIASACARLLDAVNDLTDPQRDTRSR